MTDGRTAPFPTRPVLTTPRQLQRREFVELERQRLAAQPRLGLAGIAFAVAVFIPLAFGAGDPESSLRIFAPLATFALPPIAVVAFWWEDWPGTRVRAPWSGLIDTVVVVVAAVVLTIAGMGVVERIDLQGIFDAQPGPGHPTTFPATLPLAGAAFAAVLQLTLVCEGWPLRRLGPLPAGTAALAVSWAVAVASYLLLVNTDAVPASVRSATGLRNPGGPVAASDFGSALIVLGMWQSLLFIGLRGWPFAGLARRSHRLLLGNAVVIGAGALTYAGLRDAADWENETINAACGCVIASVLIVAMLFEGWPASRLAPSAARVVTLGLIIVVATGLNRALTAYADNVSWARASPDDWVATAALTFLGAGVILHVAIGRRWPLAITPRSVGMDPEQLTNSLVGKLVEAINEGDRDAFLALLSQDAVLTDDGKPRGLTDWIDREIFTAHGHMTVEREQDQGLRLLARYRNDTWGEMSTFWRFQLSGDKISRIDTGQA